MDNYLRVYNQMHLLEFFNYTATSSIVADNIFQDPIDDICTNLIILHFNLIRGLKINQNSHLLIFNITNI